MFSKRIISMLVVLSFISQALVVVDTDSYSSVVVEDSSILEELSEQNGARTGEPSYTVYTNDEMDPINFEVPTVQVSYNGNGTAWMVKDIYSGSDGSDPEHLTAFGNEVYFEAYNGTHQLWKTDGTSSGTVQVKEFNGNALPGDFTVLGNTLFFTAETIANGRELWRTDGLSLIHI